MAFPLRTLTRSFTGCSRFPGWRPLVAAGAVALVQSMALGQAPNVDRALLTASSPLSGTQTTALKDFVSRWVSDIATASDPAEVTAARNALTDPARDPSATPIFRRAYSGAVLAELAPIVEGKDLRRAVNGLQVARFLRSPESVDLIAGRLQPTAEPNPAKRLAAASVLAAAVLDADLSAVQCDGITRNLVAAARAETDDQVLLQEMKVLNGIARRSNLPPATAEAAQAAQVAIFSGLVQGVASSPKADPRMASVARALVSLRNQWLELSRPQAAKFGPTLGPTIGAVLETANRHWDSAREDPSVQSAYEISVATGETLLRLIDRTLRPNAYPAPKPGAKDDEARVLASSWTGGLKDAFSAEVQRWNGIVKAAPYASK
jgi:hypothetical protein